MRRPRFAPIPAALPATVPFVGPEELQRRIGSVFDARIGANESGFGPSPHAIQAMQAELPRLWQYGDSTSHQLVEALAEHLDVPGVHITVGEGEDYAERDDNEWRKHTLAWVDYEGDVTLDYRSVVLDPRVFQTELKHVARTMPRQIGTSKVGVA